MSEEMSMLEPTASSEYVNMMARGRTEEVAKCSGEEEDSSSNCESFSSNWQVSSYLFYNMFSIN